MPIPVNPRGEGQKDKDQGLPKRPGTNIPARSKGLPTALPSSQGLPTSPARGLPSRPTQEELPSRPTRPGTLPTQSSLPKPPEPASTPEPTYTPEPTPEPAEKVKPPIPDFLLEPDTPAAPATPAASVPPVPVPAPAAPPIPEPSSIDRPTELVEPTKRKKFRKTAGHDPKAGKRNKDKNNSIRFVTIGLLLVLAGLGAKSAVAPPQPPSTTEIAGSVQELLGLSGFPRETAEGFALSFAKAYFSPFDSSEYISDEPFAKYVDSAVIPEISAARPTGGLSVKEGPYLAGVRETSPNDAVITVKILLSSGKWTYVDIPVQWNNLGTDKSDFGVNLSISGAPTIVPAPTLADIELDDEAFSIDDEATLAFDSVLPTFLKAWASSDDEGLAAFTVSEGSSRVLLGLQKSVALDSIGEVSVSETIPGLDLGGTSSQWGVREARVTVDWFIPGTADEDDPDTLASYTSRYLLALTYDSSAQKWVVFDIRSLGLSPN